MKTGEEDLRRIYGGYYGDMRSILGGYEEVRGGRGYEKETRMIFGVIKEK